MEASFGRLLREHRLSAGLSQEELAERAGLSVRAVSDMERGRTTHPYPRSVRLLVVALGLSAGDAERLVAATAARERDMPPGPESGPRQLPAPVRDFVGRVTELRQLDDLLADVETGPVVVAVSGTAGVGKTALALHWAHAGARPVPGRPALREPARLRPHRAAGRSGRRHPRHPGRLRRTGR